MLSLADDPTEPLFFGRLDYAADLGAEHDETLYVGRRHIHDEDGGEPLVIDWRAPRRGPSTRRGGRPAAPSRRRRLATPPASDRLEDEVLVP